MRGAMHIRKHMKFINKKTEQLGKQNIKFTHLQKHNAYEQKNKIDSNVQNNVNVLCRTMHGRATMRPLRLHDLE